MADNQGKRKNYPSEDPNAKRQRYVKMKEAGKMKPTGALKFTCKDESEKLQLQMKFDRARRVLNPEPNTVSNENLLNIVFDYFLAHCKTQ